MSQLSQLSQLSQPLDNDLVTVVIPACNEERSIGGCLESVCGQDYRNLQVVVVVGDSDDRTAEIVGRCAALDPRVELHDNPRRHIPSSLNLAVRHARGRWLVRVDAHCTVGPDYVRIAVERLREGWGGVGGRKNGVGRTRAGRAIAVAMASRFGVGGSTYHHGTRVQEVDHLAFGAYPLEVVRDAGGWDERLTANEDFELDHRLRRSGLRLLFEPRMVISWECRQSIPDLWRQYRRYGRGKVDVLRLHPRSAHPRHLAPPVLVACLAAGVTPPARRSAAYRALVAGYVGVVAAGSGANAGRLRTPAERMTLPAAFLAMHLGWGLGFWEGVAAAALERTAGLDSPS